MPCNMPDGTFAVLVRVDDFMLFILYMSCKILSLCHAFRWSRR